MKDWYEENIEEGVRDVVKLLRDNGFNTVCSCHHSMEVMLESHMDGEIKRLHDLLFNSGEKSYSIQWNVNVQEGFTVSQWMQVILCRTGISSLGVENNCSGSSAADAIGADAR